LKVGTWIVHTLSETGINDEVVDKIVNKIPLQVCDESINLFERPCKKDTKNPNPVLLISRHTVAEIGKAVYSTIEREEAKTKTVCTVMKNIAKMGELGYDAARWWIDQIRLEPALTGNGRKFLRICFDEMERLKK
jgi:hypothetical protein